ncbi:MAG: hypothetical protein PQJ46_09455 [Spirochaetales bacterium]|nr:hypothetical protein [Spirochaetales bacterium]
MSNKSPASLTNQSKITMKVDNEILSGWQGLTVALCIDACSNAFSFSLPWNPTPENRARFRPYCKRNKLGKSEGLQKIYIYLDDTKILTGYLEKPHFHTGADGRTANLQGRSASGIMMEISAGPPFQYSKVMFNTLSKKLYQALYSKATGGIAYASPDFGPIGEVSIAPGQTMWDVFSKLASAQGLWARPTAGGELEFTQFSSSQKSVAYLEEGKGPVRSVDTDHDVTKRFQRYMVVGTYEGDSSQTEIYDYETFGIAIRGRKIQQLDQQTTDIKTAAKFARARALIDSYSVTAIVDGWHYNGQLWTPGEIVTIKAPGAFIDKDTRLIIRRASLSIDESGGQTATLDLTLPQAFDNSDISSGDLPWVG